MNSISLDGLQQVLSVIQKADSALLFTHVSPDGDTLGSALALQSMLKRMGKHADVVVNYPIPAYAYLLPGIEQTIASGSPLSEADIHISIDVATVQRLGETNQLLFGKNADTVLLDHHGTGAPYAAHNWVVPDAAATGILIYHLMKAFGLHFSKEEAQCLYAAISTDTGNFIYDNVTAECFEIIADLMRQTGFRPGENGYGRALHRSKEPALLQLLGCALPRMRILAGGKVTGLYITKEEIAGFGATTADCDSLIDYAIDRIGAVLSYCIKELPDGSCKCSLRSAYPYRVDQIAASLGGGGHAQASGITAHVSLAEMANCLERELLDELSKHE